MNLARWFVVPIAASAAIATGPLMAQQTRWQRVGVQDVLALDKPLAVMDDLDGDGWQDILCPAVRWNNGMNYLTSSLFLSGRDGSTIREHFISNVAYAYTAAARVGDVNGDGVADYARTRKEYIARQPNVVEVRSGVDDTLLWSVSGPWGDLFGQVLLGDLDVNGDGWPDLLVTAEQEPPTEAIYGFDHQGRQLFRLTDPRWMHSNVIGSMGGDYDGDGCDDFLVGGNEPQIRGAAYVISGRTQQVLISGTGEKPGDGLGGGTVTGCGDIDHDGVLDFVGSSHGGGPIPGVVRVFSGATGNAIYSWRMLPGSGYGADVVAGDLDLDGIDDLLIVAPPAAKGQDARLQWRSLRGGSLVTYIESGTPCCTAFGQGTVMVPSAPTHRFPLVYIPEPGFGSSILLSYQGRITAVETIPKIATSTGPDCMGSLSSVPVGGARMRGESGLRLHVSNAPPGVPVALLIGLSTTSWGGAPLPLSVSSLGFPGCSLYGSIDLTVPARTGVGGTTDGYASFDVPQIPGLPLHGQWLVLQPSAGGLGALTGGLRW